MPLPRICALLLAGAVLPAPVAAQLQDLTPVPASRPFPVCTAWLHDWAAGVAADPGLLTFGTAFLPRTGAAGSSGVPPRPSPVTEALAGARAAYRAAGVELGLERGPLLAGTSEPTEVPDVYLYLGPTATHRTRLGIRVRESVSLDGLAASADVTTDGRRLRVRNAGVGLAAGAVLVYGGALRPRTGPRCGGGLVLGDSGAPLRGVELRLTRPVRAPAIGRVQIGVQLGVLPEAGPGNRWPLFHAMRLEIRPGEDLVVGLNRAVIFGGSRSDVPLTARTLALMLAGVTDVEGKDSDFENQVASVDVRWRATAAGRPVLVTAEYGTDDSGWAFARVPGVQLGAEIAWSPVGRGWTGLTLVALSPPSRAYPAWYRHGALAWGWTDRGTPLGSWLGGEGFAALATLRRESAEGAMAIGLGPVRRGRHNLFAPDLQGTGWTATFELDRTVGAWRVELQGRVEAGGPRAARWTSSVVRGF